MRKGVKILGLLIIVIAAFGTIWRLKGEKKYQLPLITRNVIPFGMNDLENDISVEKSALPKNIKRITQFCNDTILNIIEYDVDGNEIFKYYKQEVGSFWNGKYVTMIVGNLFEKGKVKETYYFHSNVGFSLIRYRQGFLEDELKIYEAPEDGTEANTNPFKEIDTLKNYQQLLSHEMVTKLIEIELYNSVTRKYPLLFGYVKQFYNSELVCTYITDEEGQVLKEDWGGGQINSYQYDKRGLIIAAYEIHGVDTTRTRKEHYNTDQKVDTLKVNDWTSIFKYDSGRVDELIFNGDLNMGTKRTVYNNLGYPEVEFKIDEKGKIKSERHFVYQVEFYK